MVGRGQAKMLTNFIKSGAKTSGAGERPEAAQWIISLLDAAISLLDPIVEVLTGSVQHLAAKDAMNSPRIRRVLIGGLRWLL